MAINNRGDVVGFANAAEGEGFSAEAFLWTKHTGRMKPLGTLGRAFSQALGVNWRGQVVCVYFDTPQDVRAFVWDEDEGMRDLTRLAPDFSGVLVDALYINERGQITGEAFDRETGEVRAFVATPVPVRRSAALGGS
jgi:probable HAF family extracellular repeat protein